MQKTKIKTTREEVRPKKSKFYSLKSKNANIEIFEN